VAIVRKARAKEAEIWAVASGDREASLAQEDYVRHMVLSPDGKYLAASSGKSVTVWDWVGGRKLLELPPHSDNFSLYALEFTPDGKHIVTAGYSKQVKVWAWRQEELIRDACSRLERNLTEEEWRTYLGDASYEPTCPELPIGESRK
jgi:uncharacterized protein with WD repeat